MEGQTWGFCSKRGKKQTNKQKERMDVSGPIFFFKKKIIRASVNQKKKKKKKEVIHQIFHHHIIKVFEIQPLQTLQVRVCD